MNKLTIRGNLKSQSITNEVLINKRAFKIFNIRKIRRAKC